MSYQNSKSLALPMERSKTYLPPSNPEHVVAFKILFRDVVKVTSGSANPPEVAGQLESQPIVRRTEQRVAIKTGPKKYETQFQYLTRIRICILLEIPRLVSAYNDLVGEILLGLRPIKCVFPLGGGDAKSPLNDDQKIKVLEEIKRVNGPVSHIMATLKPLLSQTFQLCKVFLEFVKRYNFSENSLIDLKYEISLNHYRCRKFFAQRRQFQSCNERLRVILIAHPFCTDAWIRLASIAEKQYLVLRNSVCDLRNHLTFLHGIMVSNMEVLELMNCSFRKAAEKNRKHKYMASVSV